METAYDRWSGHSERCLGHSLETTYERCRLRRWERVPGHSMDTNYERCRLRRWERVPGHSMDTIYERCGHSMVTVYERCTGHSMEIAWSAQTP